MRTKNESSRGAESPAGQTAPGSTATTASGPLNREAPICPLDGVEMVEAIALEQGK